MSNLIFCVRDGDCEDESTDFVPLLCVVLRYHAHINVYNTGVSSKERERRPQVQSRFLPIPPCPPSIIGHPHHLSSSRLIRLAKYDMMFAPQISPEVLPNALATTEPYESRTNSPDLRKLSSVPLVVGFS